MFTFTPSVFVEDLLSGHLVRNKWRQNVGKTWREEKQYIFLRYNWSELVAVWDWGWWRRTSEKQFHGQRRSFAPLEFKILCQSQDRKKNSHSSFCLSLPPPSYSLWKKSQGLETASPLWAAGPRPSEVRACSVLASRERRKIEGTGSN